MPVAANAGAAWSTIGAPVPASMRRSDVEMVKKSARLSKAARDPLPPPLPTTRACVTASFSSQDFHVASRSARTSPSLASLLTAPRLASSARLAWQPSLAVKMACALPAAWRMTARKRPAPFSATPQYLSSARVMVRAPSSPSSASERGSASVAGKKARISSSMRAAAIRTRTGSGSAAQSNGAASKSPMAVATPTESQPCFICEFAAPIPPRLAENEPGSPVHRTYKSWPESGSSRSWT